MKLLNGTLDIIRNKYFIASAFFIIWMVFIDEKDWSMINGRMNKLVELQKSEQHLTGLISESRNELNLLKTNAGTIEKYAREKYLMKKDNEDLFIVLTP